MTQRHHLKPGDVLLVGRLDLPGDPGRYRAGRSSIAPTLSLAVWCPRCRQLNHHGFPDAGEPGFTLASVTHRAAHCGCGSYWIGLDPHPEAKADHLARLSAFADLAASWERARGRPAALDVETATP